MIHKSSRGGKVYLAGLPTVATLEHFPATDLQIVCFPETPAAKGGAQLPGAMVRHLSISNMGGWPHRAVATAMASSTIVGVRREYHRHSLRCWEASRSCSGRSGSLALGAGIPGCISGLADEASRCAAAQDYPRQRRGAVDVRHSEEFFTWQSSATSCRVCSNHQESATCGHRG